MACLVSGLLCPIRALARIKDNFRISRPNTYLDIHLAEAPSMPTLSKVR